MGKHSSYKKSARRKKAHPILRGFFIATLLFVGAVVIAAYGYAKLFEAKIRDNARNEDINKVIVEPIGNEPMNIMLLGSDARSKRERARTDTIIILRLIPKENRVAMISIPRDLRVNIPGHGLDKINAAHVYGGPELAIRTVSSLTGLDIHHYAEVQFWGFKKIVDALGGVTINVEKPLVDRKTKFGIAAGVQRMDGDRALNYCRFRKDATGDFGRIDRQQRFFRAILDESLRFRSMFKIPTVINIVAENTQSDMGSGEMLSIASFLVKLDKDDFETATLPGAPKMINGISYVVADETAMQEILTKIKNNQKLSQSPTVVKEKGALSGENTPKEHILQNEDITVAVQNGCTDNGIAKVLSDLLDAKDFAIIEEPKNASWIHTKTTIYYMSGMKKRADVLSSFFAGPVIRPLSNAVSSKAQVVIVIGKDHKKVLSI